MVTRFTDVWLANWETNLILLSILAALIVWGIAVLAQRAYRSHYLHRGKTWRKPGFWENYSLRHAISADIFQSDDDVTMSLYARLILAAYRIAVPAFYCLLFVDVLCLILHFL